MIIQLDARNIPLQQLHNFCIQYGLTLDLDTMTVDLMEITYNGGKNEKNIGRVSRRRKTDDTA